MFRGVFVFFCLLIFQVLSTYRITVTYGEPGIYTASTNYSLSWSDCLTYCYSNTSCLVIYELDDDNCQVFAVGEISSVTRLYSGNRIGVRSITNSTTCSSQLTSTVESGYYYDNSTGTYQSYTATYSDDSWTFNTSSVLSCPTNFTMFIRDLGPWCMKVVDAGGCYNRTHCATACSSTYGGVLSGLDTTEEYDFVIGKAVSIPSSPTTDWKYAFWVDGTRKSNCSFLTNKTASCNGTSEFEFSDPTLSSDPQGYEWGNLQPDGITSNASNSIVARVQNKAGIGMDDTPGSFANSTKLCYRGYVCGLSPS